MQPESRQRRHGDGHGGCYSGTRACPCPTAPQEGIASAAATDETVAFASSALVQAPASLTPWSGPTVLSAPRLGTI